MQNPVQDKLVVIEGGDAAGKKTQAGLLRDALVNLGISCSVLSFPRYDRLYGSLIRKSLDGEFGNFLALNPYQASAFYALDRAGAKEELLKALEQGVVLCDRYTPSNIAFQGAKLEGTERAKFIRFTEEAEYGELGLPKPSLVIYLAVPVPISSRLSRGRAKPDQHEADLDYQEKVAGVYAELASARKDWTIVQCISGGKLRSPEDIHRDVLSFVLPVLNG